MKKTFKTLVPLCMIILLSFFSCKKENGEENNKCENYIVVNNNYINVNNNNGLFVDKINDVEKTFVDLDTLSIKISSDYIDIKIGLMNISESLTFGQKALASNCLNYDWTISFDVDNSDSLSKGDVLVSVSKYKGPMESEITTKEILKITQQSIWIYDGNKTNNAANIDNYSIIKNNSFEISIPKTLHTTLKSINSDTKINFRAHFYDGSNFFTDYYPDLK